MDPQRVFGWALATALAWPATQATSLTINGSYFGGTPSAYQVGGGSLDQIFRTAAGFWERAIHDDVTVDLVYGWSPLDDGTLGYSLGTAILLDNDTFTWFVDATPDDDAEWSSFQITTQDLGGVGGPMVTGRVFHGALGLAAGAYDLLSVLTHEIGHSLGFVQGTAFNAETADGDVDLTAPRPFAGASLPTTTVGGGHLNIPEALMYPYFNDSERTLPSEADILGVAQVNGWSQLTLDPARVPEPAPAALVAIAGLLLAGLRRPSGPACTRSARCRRAPAAPSARRSAS